MKVIHKFEIPLRNMVNKIIMPQAAEILSVQADRSTIWLWALVDHNSKSATRRIVVIGTGQYVGEVVPLKEQHIGTVQEKNSFDDIDYEVYHIFDLGEA